MPGPLFLVFLMNFMVSLYMSPCLLKSLLHPLLICSWSILSTPWISNFRWDFHSGFHNYPLPLSVLYSRWPQISPTTPRMGSLGSDFHLDSIRSLPWTAMWVVLLSWIGNFGPASSLGRKGLAPWMVHLAYRYRDKVSLGNTPARSDISVAQRRNLESLPPL